MRQRPTSQQPDREVKRQCAESAQNQKEGVLEEDGLFREARFVGGGGGGGSGCGGEGCLVGFFDAGPG